MKTTNDEFDMDEIVCDIMEEELFNSIMEVVRENFVAIFMNESDLSAIIRFTNGQKFRLELEEICS